MRLVLASAGGLLLTTAALAGCNTRHARCVDNGGQWVAVNRREVEDEICTTSDFGNGMVITTCVPMTSTACDHECHGASAEAVAR